MSQETLIKVWCDFSSAVRQHPAQYRIVRGVDRIDHLDSCKAHLARMIDAVVEASDVSKIVVERIEKNDADKPKPTREPTGETHPCAACPKVFDTEQGRSLHYRRVHAQARAS